MTIETSPAPSGTEATSPVRIRKVSHVVFEVSDMARSLDFWTRIMGFAVSDTNERGMVFLHNGPDHHSVALVESPGMTPPRENEALRVLHFAFEIEGAEQLLQIRQFLLDNNVE
ncbi:MAG: VOC family protein, partial [Acidimicrobiales bacterium]